MKLSIVLSLIGGTACAATMIDRPCVTQREFSRTGSTIEIVSGLSGYDPATMTLSGVVSATEVTKGWNFCTIAPKSGYAWRTTGYGDAIGIAWRIVSPSSVHAADDLSVDWTTEALTTSAQVSTEGTRVYAYTADSTASLVLNGVSFVSGGATPSALGEAGDVVLSGFTREVGYTTNPGAGSATHFLLMARSAYTTTAKAATVTLKNLTAGHRYLVQILSHDGHTSSVQYFNYRMSADDADWRYLGGEGENRSPHGCTFLGRFTATGTTFAFPLRSEGRLVINALQVRDLGSDDGAKIARVPVGSANVIFDGTPRRGVADGVGYSVTDSFATSAGDYTATATLDAGYTWADGLATASRPVPFTVRPAPNAITYFRPLDFAADATMPNLPVLCATGGTPVFRYCRDAAGTDEIAIDGTQQPGTYYVFASLPEGNYKSVSTNGTMTIRPAGWKGPKVAIVGDSYSTFAGIPGCGAIHYPGTKNDIYEVTETWWWQVIEGLSGARLETDLAYAGSELVGGKNVSGVSFQDRIAQSGLGTLGADDMIFVCGGLNDVMLSGHSADAVHLHAVTVLRQINELYPLVRRKFFIGQNLLQNYNNRGVNYLIPIRTACEETGWVFINTAKVLGEQGYAPNMHWGVDGARRVARQILSVYDEREKNGANATL